MQGHHGINSNDKVGREGRGGRAGETAKYGSRRRSEKKSGPNCGNGYLRCQNTRNHERYEHEEKMVEAEEGVSVEKEIEDTHGVYDEMSDGLEMARAWTEERRTEVSNVEEQKTGEQRKGHRRPRKVVRALAALRPGPWPSCSH